MLNHNSVNSHVKEICDSLHFCIFGAREVLRGYIPLSAYRCRQVSIRDDERSAFADTV